MERLPLASTSIASAGYEPETRTHEIEVRSGQLMSAESAGGYFVRRVREQFAFERLAEAR
jgi:hypothetical protein